MAVWSGTEDAVGAIGGDDEGEGWALILEDQFVTADNAPTLRNMVELWQLAEGCVVACRNGHALSKDLKMLTAL